MGPTLRARNIPLANNVSFVDNNESTAMARRDNGIVMIVECILNKVTVEVQGRRISYAPASILLGRREIVFLWGEQPSLGPAP